MREVLLPASVVRHKYKYCTSTQVRKNPYMFSLIMQEKASNKLRCILNTAHFTTHCIEDTI